MEKVIEKGFELCAHQYSAPLPELNDAKQCCKCGRIVRVLSDSEYREEKARIKNEENKIIDKYKIKKGVNYIHLSSSRMDLLAVQLNELVLITGVYMEIEDRYHTPDIKNILVKVIYE